MAFWRSSSQPSDSPAGHLRPPVALALQGGGAYGAFAWGVLDRLLDEPDFVPGAISGASAGAINGVITAWGYLQGGRDGARRALRQLWDTVGQLSLLSPSDLPGFDVQLEFLTRLVSPYQFNPLNINPLREALSDMVDFGRLCAEGVIPLFISATDVSTGQQRIFREDEITIDVLMASSCLPSLCQAVEIDGHSYWDGGFTSNPPMLPMVLDTPCRSLFLIKLTADMEPELPKGAPEINARLRRILFNAPLLHDLEAIDQMQKQLRRTSLLPSDLRRVRDLSIRAVSIDPSFFAAGSGSSLSPRPEFLARLHDSGRLAAAGLVGCTPGGIEGASEQREPAGGPEDVGCALDAGG